MIFISCATFTVTSSTGTIVSLNQPSSINDDDSRNIKAFFPWSGYTIVIDDGRDSKQINLSGIENINAYTSMVSLNWVTDSGDEITIAGINDEINGTYQIENFSYSVNPGEVGTTYWNITIEKT